MKLARNLSVVACGATLCLAMASANGADDPATLKVLQQGEITYVSGGVGADEIAALRVVAKRYNLKLAFSTTSGAHLANVKVSLRDGAGKTMLETVSDGPCLYAQVPAGQYKISAETLDKSFTKVATLSAKRGANVQFLWRMPREAIGDEAAEAKESHEPNAVRGCF